MSWAASLVMEPALLPATLLRGDRFRRRPTPTAPDRDVLRVHRPCEPPAVPVSVVVRQCTDQLSGRRHVDLKRRGRTGARRRYPELMPVGEVVGLLNGDRVCRRGHGEPGGPCNAT